MKPITERNRLNLWSRTDSKTAPKSKSDHLGQDSVELSNGGLSLKVPQEKLNKSNACANSFTASEQEPAPARQLEEAADSYPVKAAEKAVAELPASTSTEVQAAQSKSEEARKSDTDCQEAQRQTAQAEEAATKSSEAQARVAQMSGQLENLQTQLRQSQGQVAELQSRIGELEALAYANPDDFALQLSLFRARMELQQARLREAAAQLAVSQTSQQLQGQQKLATSDSGNLTVLKVRSDFQQFKARCNDLETAESERHESEKTFSENSTRDQVARHGMENLLSNLFTFGQAPLDAPTSGVAHTDMEWLLSDLRLKVPARGI